MKKKKKCYIAYTIDIDKEYTVNLGFHLFEMLGISKNVFIQFFRMYDSYFNLDKIYQYGYKLDSDKEREDIKYFSFNQKIGHRKLTSMINLKMFDDAQSIDYFWGYDCVDTIRNEMWVSSSEKLFDKNIIKFKGSIDIDTVDLTFSPEYYLENKEFIDGVLQDFEEKYKDYIYDKYTKIKL